MQGQAPGITAAAGGGTGALVLVGDARRGRPRGARRGAGHRVLRRRRRRPPALLLQQLLRRQRLLGRRPRRGGPVRPGRRAVVAVRHGRPLLLLLLLLRGLLRRGVLLWRPLATLRGRARVRDRRRCLLLLLLVLVVVVVGWGSSARAARGRGQGLRHVGPVDGLVGPPLRRGLLQPLLRAGARPRALHSAHLLTRQTLTQTCGWSQARATRRCRLRAHMPCAGT